MANIRQVAKLIALTGTTNTVFVQGEPGCGKSSLLPLLAGSFGDKWTKVGDVCETDKYQYIYVDCPLMDLPKIGLPYVKDGVTHDAPGAIWGLNDPRPKVIMLDEISKAANAYKPVFTRMMLERCIGESRLPDGSIVFATGNNSSDGVGDTMQGHINNRITHVPMTKPTAEEWIEWAHGAGVNEIVIAGVHEMPNVLQSYLDDPEGHNTYIFNPKKNRGAFASPRSLHKAGHICDQLTELGQPLALTALEGTVGVSFANMLLTYINMRGEVPKWEDIEKNPSDMAIPDSPAVQLMLVFGSVQRLNKDSAVVLSKYFMRFPLELRMLWLRQFRNMPDKLSSLIKIKEVAKILTEEHWVFGTGK